MLTYYPIFSASSVLSLLLFFQIESQFKLSLLQVEYENLIESIDVWFLIVCILFLWNVYMPILVSFPYSKKVVDPNENTEKIIF